METMEGQVSSILEMTQGAIKERVDHEMDRIIDNILDPNTKATAKRKMTLTIELTPDDTRCKISASIVAKSTLATANPVQTSLCVTSGGDDGQMVVAELVPHIPGQLFMNGKEQEKPKILNIAGMR